MATFSGASRENTILALAQAMKGEPRDPENVKDISSMWIDVEKRLPNEEEVKRMNGHFLVCRSNGKLYIDTYLSEGNGYAPKGFYVKDSTRVVAWMNLPEPFIK